MATKKTPGKKRGAEKSKKPARKRVDVKDLDTKKDPKGGPDMVGWLPG